MDIIDSIILGIIEGITEFLPISSTGHMILTAHLLKIQENEFVKTFEVLIQLGAISAIVWLYAKRFLTNWNLYFKLIAAFIPTGIFGFLAYDFIKLYLFSPVVVAISLVIGGIILVLIDDKIENNSSRWMSVADISYKNAFLIGLFQCLAMIPGVSRAAATIIGGVFNGLSKKQAAEFSFLLAVPTMLAASGYDLLKSNIAFTNDQLLYLAIGFLVSFVSAWFAVRLFLKLLEKFGFKYFGYYRIVLGLVFLIWIYSQSVN
ncbi:undecaprenyl-diphosphate phosphatase [Catalinimonas niigatensis]|uniref:undecaprenyl-diphosphate phosphatase n=1 Tax=Catalinimonas niigatensis TaxID=1397264 RepID=UPI002666D1EA|nr:undecaprenyl-diphosphate phosphatase [Catalinimonas niigatensis]WPP51931.1 undecaprenyl-diphosphate phosphatase [Catalinimonas niigatensis]